MATVNKSSLRTELDALKARFESLCVEGKMSADSRALVDTLLMLFEVLMAVFMEKHTPKSSANSSLPASQSPNDETARSAPGAKGKGPSHNDARCANTRTRESIRVLTVDACQRCGEDLTDAACLGHERCTPINIVFEKVVRQRTRRQDADPPASTRRATSATATSSPRARESFPRFLPDTTVSAAKWPNPMPQSVGADEELRDRRAAIRQTPQRRLHQ